jgi:transposase-like protein
MANTTKLTRENKKAWALSEYLHSNLTQKEIAEKVSVSEQTLSKWVNEGKWNTLKAGVTMTRESELVRMYNQLTELNNDINTREPGKRYASSKEADVITKLASAIRSLETEASVGDIISVSKRFLTWLRAFDLKSAQTITPLFDSFIKDSLK